MAFELYPKINTAFKRQNEKPCNIIPCTYATPDIEFLRDCNWIWTEKIDGTNIRIGWNLTDQEVIGNVEIGGRTDRAQIPKELQERLDQLFTWQKMVDTFGGGKITLYGEGFGRRIQKGGGDYISDGVDFILFDVKCGDWWLHRKDVEQIAAALDIRIVPVIRICSIPTMIRLVQHGFDSHFGNREAEGVVGRPMVQMFGRKGERIITKLKTNDFRKLAASLAAGAK